MQIDVAIGNLRDLPRYIIGYHEHVVEKTTKSRKKHAYIIERMAKSKVAVDTSRLKTSINTKHEGNASLVGTNVEYARSIGPYM